MREFHQLHHHQKFHDQLCREALKATGRSMGIGYAFALERFRACDIDVTISFWGYVNSVSPGQFSGVSYCLGCRKFNLESQPGQQAPIKPL